MLYSKQTIDVDKSTIILVSRKEISVKERFDTFVTAISQINRCIQKLKSEEMADFGLKGTHVMCLFRLQQHEEGLSSADLAKLCEEDKAAISRSIAELRTAGLVNDPNHESRHYRVKIKLTEKGREVTERMDKKIIDSVLKGAKGFTQEDRDNFYRVLLKIADNLQTACNDLEDKK